MPAPHPKPILLLADSQLLFSQGQDSVTRRVPPLLGIAPNHAKAAYLGASNGDAPEFFELFQAATARMRIGQTSHVRAGDATFLADADLVLLAGGDVARGWSAFEQAGFVPLLLERAERGAVFVGVSAGAMQLGLGFLSLVPRVIAVHEEPGWPELERRVAEEAGRVRGLGVPLGGGALVHRSRGTVEALAKPFVDVFFADGKVTTRETSSLSMNDPDP